MTSSSPHPTYRGERGRLHENSKGSILDNGQGPSMRAVIQGNLHGTRAAPSSVHASASGPNAGAFLIML